MADMAMAKASAREEKMVVVGILVVVEPPSILGNLIIFNFLGIINTVDLRISISIGVSPAKYFFK
ncbi:MAG: hypothetical protein OXI63_20130 [Candidatus Poribacteria bacterium]|nr:hypothetical protein [Candidatus Poribacteria bacterium]